MSTPRHYRTYTLITQLTWWRFSRRLGLHLPKRCRRPFVRFMDDLWDFFSPTRTFLFWLQNPSAYLSYRRYLRTGMTEVEL